MSMNYCKYAIFVAPAIVKDDELFIVGLGHIEVYRAYYIDINGKRMGYQPEIGSDGFIPSYYNRSGFIEKWYPEDFEEAYGIAMNPFETYKIEYLRSTRNFLTIPGVTNELRDITVEIKFNKVKTLFSDFEPNQKMLMDLGRESVN